MTSSRLDDVGMIPILTFLLGEQYYALFIEEVIEVAAMVELVNVTDAPAEILGLANRHGGVLPMVDLRTVMRCPHSPIDEWTLFVVASYANQSIGLVVDEVRQVEYIPVAQVHKSSASGKYIRGIISYRQRLIQLVALDALLAEYSSSVVSDNVLRIDS